MAKRTEFPAMEVVEGGEEPSHHDHCHGQQGAANCHRVPGVIVLQEINNNIVVSHLPRLIHLQ